MARYTAPAVSVALSLAILVGVANAQTLKAPTQPEPQISTPVATTTPTGKCSTGWTITGYFTPVESEYLGKMDRVYVNGTLRSFPDAFLDEVLYQGSGLLTDGTYLSYAGAWRVASSSYGSSGKPIAIGDVATDQSVLPYGTQIRIASSTYIAADTGGAIIGKHIDIYEGVGLSARAKALSITGSQVCVL